MSSETLLPKAASLASSTNFLIYSLVDKDSTEARALYSNSQAFFLLRVLSSLTFFLDYANNFVLALAKVEISFLLIRGEIGLGRG